MEITLAVRHHRVVLLLFSVMAAFAIINMALNAWLAFGLYGYTPVSLLLLFFDLGTEKNIPTLVEVGLLLCAAYLLMLAALRARSAADGMAGGWWILAGGFVLLAVDEAWSFHERLVEPMDALVGTSLPRFLAHSWVLAGIAGVAAMALVLLRFLLRLPRRLALQLLGAGAVFLGGCIGMEMVGISYYLQTGSLTLTYHLFSTMEESLEMSGVILLLRALLAELAGGAEVLHVALTLHGGAPHLADVNAPLAPHPTASRGKSAA
jgi:hypothetical protein